MDCFCSICNVVLSLVYDSLDFNEKFYNVENKNNVIVNYFWDIVNVGYYFMFIVVVVF